MDYSAKKKRREKTKAWCVMCGMYARRLLCSKIPETEHHGFEATRARIYSSAVLRNNEEKSIVFKIKLI